MTPPSQPNEKPPEKPSFNEQLADIALKVIMTGGVAGGGFGAFWSLFKDSDVPKAIASAAIGLGISYAAKMLQPLHEGNQRRLENTGKALDGAIDRMGEAAIAKVRGVEERYFQCQAWECRRNRSEGMAQHDRIFTPLLEEVFVPLDLDLSALQPGFRVADCEAMQSLSNPDGQKIWDLLQKTKQQPIFRQIVILAWGGYGKTTLLKHIAYTYGMNQQGKYQVPRRIPVLLVLRKYRDLLARDNPPGLAELITWYHVPGLPESEDLSLPSNWAKEMLQRGEAVVMLDGFDEVAKSQRSAVARWINEQMRRYGKSVFILTSRPKAYQEQDAADRLELSTRLWVRNFNENQRREFVEQWYGCQERYASGGDNTPDVRQEANRAANELLVQIEARQELKDLAKNPLLLNMIVTFHRRYPGAELPRRRAELYKEICLLQLRDRPSARKLETLLVNCDAQIVLQMLALDMMQHREERIEREKLLERLGAYLVAQSEAVKATEFLDQVVQVSELLVAQEEEYEFAHLSFQEYLAAAEVLRLKQEQLLYQRFKDDWWKQTILLYAAQVNPSSLIRAMLPQGATDLAYTCFQETAKKLDYGLEIELRRLQQVVQNSRYQALENYLKNGQWKEADNETYRLMIITVGREEGQWFDPEELLNFPCEELLAIDGLWVSYSNSQFGFSVQKDIYLSEKCGGIPDGEYHKEAWNKLCHANGWKVNNKWVDVIFNTSAPRGHLPGWVWVGIRAHGWSVSSLASRLVKCNL